MVEWLAAVTERISHQMRDGQFDPARGPTFSFICQLPVHFLKVFLNSTRSNPPIQLGRCQEAAIALGNLLAIVCAG